MGRAVVTHHHWDVPGGGQLVSAAVAVAFESIGLEPVLASVFSFDPGKYGEWFGIDLGKYENLSLFGFELKAFGLYSRLLSWVPVKRALERYDVDTVYIDNAFYRRIEGLLRRKGVKLFEYVHFPFEVYYLDPSRTLDPYIRESLERYGRFPLNVYWRLFLELVPVFTRRNPFEHTTAVLTNSRWTARVVKELYGEDPLILNPPIAPSTGIVEKPADFGSRSNSVLMLGRFSEGKRYHWVVEKVLPELRREVGSAKLYVVGGARTRSGRQYLSRVEALARRAGLRVSGDPNAEADVYLLPDALRDTINRLMDSSKVFLHATVNEHWGIAIAEAMARGLPVVVHESGGAWTDLALEGSCGLGYETESEAVEHLARLLTDEKLWTHFSKKSVERVRELTLEKFVEKFSEIVKRRL